MKLFKSTVVVSFFTLLSRITGFVRDQVVARLFGTGQWTDAFFVVFKIPNFMRRLFAEGSFSLAFVPVLNEIKASGDRQQLKDFVDHVFTALLCVLLCVLALMELFAPGVIMLFAPGFSDNSVLFQGSVDMLRITLPYLLLISLVAFSGGILNSHHRFAVPALTPILLNVSLVVCAFWLHGAFEIPVKALAIGVLIAGFTQLLFQLPFLYSLGLLPRFRMNFKDPSVRKVGRLMLPTLLGSSVAQVNLLVDTMIATLLPLVGSVTFLYFADRMMEFPLGVFGIAIATVILPKLSLDHAQNNDSAFSRTVKWSIGLAIFISLPCAVALAYLAKPVMVTLFEYGKFTEQDTYYSSIALSVYMIGLPAFVLNKVLLPIFFSRKDAKTPVKIALLVLALNVVLNVGFVYILWYLGFVSLHVGLALASSLCAWVQAFLLYFKLRGTGVLKSSVFSAALIVKTGLACLVMLSVLYFYQLQIEQWSQLSWYMRSFHLSMMVVTGSAAYLATAWVSQTFKYMAVHENH